MRNAIAIRNAQMDEIANLQDCFDETNYAEKLANVAKDLRVYSTDSELRVLADERSGCVPSFAVFISKKTQLAECYSKFVKVVIPFVNGVRVHRVSQVAEIVKYLRNYEHEGSQVWFIERQIELVSNCRFNSSDLANALTLRSRSAACYEAFREFLVLPGQRLLQQLTKSVSDAEDVNYVQKLLDVHEPQQRQCVLMCHEVHVKSFIQYEAAPTTCSVAENVGRFTSTVLAVMCVCLFGGAKFCVRLLPDMNLTGAFLSDVLRSWCTVIRDGGGRVVAVIADNFGVSQTAFSNLMTDAKFPWRALSPEGQPIFLLYDTVHIIKSVRNSWISEQDRELLFRSFQSENAKLARWKCVESLCVENDQPLHAQAKLSAKAAHPNPMERQSASLVLQVFCDSTVASLRLNGASDTADFVELMVQFWKVSTVHALNLHIRHSDAYRQAVTRDDAWQFKFLSLTASLAQYMCPAYPERPKALTRDSANALYSTCHGLIELCRHLFTSNVKFVLLGQFNTERIEQQFGKSRQACNGTYLMSVRSLLEKHKLENLRILFDWNADEAAETSVDAASHSCKRCNGESFANTNILPLLAREIPDKVKQVLVYVAGYLTSKYCSCEEDSVDACFEYDSRGQMLNLMDCGRLSGPGDRLVTFVYFAYLSFLCLQSDSTPPCFHALMRSLSQIHAQYDLLHSASEAKLMCRALSNIMLTNFMPKG